MVLKKSNRALTGDKERREQIVSAALECFLKFGYAKTSLDDIAKKAFLSRPLLYLKFKNKEEILKAVFDQFFSDGYEAADLAVSVSASRKNKLSAIYDALVLRPWDRIMGQPMSAEFYEICERFFPDLCSRYEKEILKHVTHLLEDKQLAQVFVLAAEGLQSDLPSTAVLRKRLDILIDQFI